MLPVLDPGSARLIESIKNLHEGPLVLPDVVRLGEAAVPALEAILRGPSQSVYHARYLAADALGAVGGPAAQAALIRALRDSIARTADAASLEAEGVIVNRVADHLSGCREPEATEALLEALRVRPYPACARALGRLRETRAIPLLLDCLDDDAAREAAVEALCRFASEACAPLIRVLTQPRLIRGVEPPSRIDGRTAAARALGTIADAEPALNGAELALRAALEDRQRKVRIEAALALSRRGGSAAREAAALLAAALDETSWVRAETVMRALVRIGPAAEPVLAPFITTRPTDAPSRRRRIRAVTLAGQLRSESAVAALTALADAHGQTLRLAAITALARIPAAGPDSLARFLHDEAAPVRRRALIALWERRDLRPEWAAMLLGDPDLGIRRLAQTALCDSGTAALPPLGRILRTFGSPAHGLRRRARLWWWAGAWLLVARRSARDSRPAG